MMDMAFAIAFVQAWTVVLRWISDCGKCGDVEYSVAGFTGDGKPDDDEERRLRYRENRPMLPPGMRVQRLYNR